MAWMQKQSAAGKPFFAYIATNAPHMPLWPPDSHANLYAGQVPAQAAAFFAMIANLDDNIGKLDKWLKDNRQFDDTILVFLTDNGGTAGRGVHNAGLRDGKASSYEGGHRVPCFVRWPAGGFDKGLEVKTPTQAQDILPTVLELSEVAAGNAKFDGASLAPLLRKRTLPDRMLVVQYGARQRPLKYDAAVIWNQWRLQKGTELYDIETDRAQQKNVAAAHADVVARMRGYYDAWWAKLEPLQSQPVPVVLGATRQNPSMLTSVDWWEVDCDNIDFVSRGEGGPRGGPWHVDVANAGNYRFELRRWPLHTDKALGSEGPRVTINGRALTQPVKRMPARSVVFAADGAEQSLAVTPEDLGATFQVRLTKGRHVLQGWLRDAEGKDLCGAYYARVTKV
jgi:hypothetical protein